MARIVVALGSNLGDRLAHFQNAKKLLTRFSESRVICSSIYETEPLGSSDKMYYNAVSVLHSQKPPMELLDEFKAFEQQAGRNMSARKWSDREIDIDIIDYENVTLHTDRLILPHPNYITRKFVLIPLKEIYPDWIDPATGRPISELIARADDLGVFKTSLKW